MSVRVTASEDKVALFDSVTGLAFGPVFEHLEEADGFLTFLEEIGERDPRIIPALELAELAEQFLAEREAA